MVTREGWWIVANMSVMMIAALLLAAVLLLHLAGCGDEGDRKSETFITCEITFNRCLDSASAEGEGASAQVTCENEYNICTANEANDNVQVDGELEVDAL